MMFIFKSFEFEAAHFLPNVPKGHKCGNLHGHTYRVELCLQGEIDQVSGWFIDFTDVSDVCKGLHRDLDHRCLNDVLPNPTSENLAIWIWNKVVDKFDGKLYSISVSETCSSRVLYKGKQCTA
jgi:6-pyruvoyltetrahydropterin/6-carboxytetrahydropterin synthase